MGIGRGVWVGTVLVATAAACSTGTDTSFEPDEGGAPHYEGGASSDSGKPGSGGDATTGSEAGGGDATSGVDATEASPAAEASSTAEAGLDGGAGDAHLEASGGDGSATGDGGSDAAPIEEAGADAPPEAQAEPDSGSDGAAGAGTEAGPDAAPEAGVDAATDAAADAGPDAISIVPPTCDGAIGAGEYGGSGNQAAAAPAQTWYMTWDETNLYVAIANANVDEGCVIYLAIDPSSAAGGTTSGHLYDSTDITTLPFSATLVVYAHDGYTEARTATGGAWSATADTTSVRQCDNATTQVREEVIPWSLIGGRPASFGWLGYIAAASSSTSNPNGYIYGQIPADNRGGGPANNLTYTHYYLVPDATPGVDLPFANEH
jgi:hypothetical protein